MKKIVSIVLFAGCIFGFVACQKESLDPGSESPSGRKLHMIIKAEQSSTTKTVLEGTAPKWKNGDKVTVMYEKNSGSGWSIQDSDALSGAGESYATASFSVTLADANTSKNAYAIYPANDLTQSESDKAKITIAATQHPTGTSFDGASDILISKPFTPAASVSTQFSRPGAVLKIKISNAALYSEKLLSLSVTGANALAGDVLVNLSDAAVSGIENGSTTVTAEYESENQFTVGSSNFVYLIVKPQTLLDGSTLTVEGETENYTFSKAITLDKNIYLNAGHIVPLRIDIDSYTLKDRVFFEERFSAAAGTAGWSGSAAKGDFVSDNTWSVNSYVFGGAKCARIGDSDQKGEATTSSITITPALYTSQIIKLTFKAGAWDTGSEQTTFPLTITGAKFKIGETKVSSTSVEMSKGSYTEYTYEITDITSAIQLTFAGKNKNSSRFFLDDVCVYYGSKPKMPAGLSYSTTSVFKDFGDAAFTNPLSNPNSLSISYESSDPSVAVVDSEGEVTILKQGVTRITANGAATSDYVAGAAYYDLIVTKKTAFSWSRTSSTDTITADGFASLASNKANLTGYAAYYGESGSVGAAGYLRIYNPSTAMFSSKPSVIRLTAKIGGNNTGAISSPVYACLVDSDGNNIDGTEVEVTSNIETSAGDVYEILMEPVSSANGVKLYHTKQSDMSVRFYSASLKYNE